MVQRIAHCRQNNRTQRGFKCNIYFKIHPKWCKNWFNCPMTWPVVHSTYIPNICHRTFFQRWLGLIDNGVIYHTQFSAQKASSTIWDSVWKVFDKIWLESIFLWSVVVYLLFKIVVLLSVINPYLICQHFCWSSWFNDGPHVIFLFYSFGGLFDFHTVALCRAILYKKEIFLYRVLGD